MDNRLSASDMSSLFAERDQVHVNVGGTLLVEGAAPSYEQLVTHLASPAHHEKGEKRRGRDSNPRESY